MIESDNAIAAIGINSFTPAESATMCVPGDLMSDESVECVWAAGCEGADSKKSETVDADEDDETQRCHQFTHGIRRRTIRRSKHRLTVNHAENTTMRKRYR